MIRIKRLDERPLPVYRRGSCLMPDEDDSFRFESPGLIERFLELVKGDCSHDT